MAEFWRVYRYNLTHIEKSSVSSNESAYYVFFETFEDAKAYALAETEKDIDRAQANLDAMRERRETIKKMEGK